MQALPEAEGQPWFLNEVRGFIWALAGSSATYLTDYVMNWGVVIKAAGSADRARLLVDACVRTGLLERVEDGGLPAVKMVEDGRLQEHPR